MLLFASLSDFCPFLCEWQVAFGSKDLEIISTGETIPISKCMRKKLKEQLWLEYREEHTLEDGTFLGMERSSFLSLTSEATGGQQKALGALDNIAVRFGTENWEELERIAKELSSLLTLPALTSGGLQSAVISAMQHVKYGLSKHLAEHSRCSKHCYSHMLSDP